MERKRLCKTRAQGPHFSREATFRRYQGENGGGYKERLEHRVKPRHPRIDLSWWVQAGADTHWAATPGNASDMRLAVIVDMADARHDTSFRSIDEGSQIRLQSVLINERGRADTVHTHLGIDVVRVLDVNIDLSRSHKLG